MGLVAEVVDVESDGNVKVDPGGGDALIADHFGPSGDDSPPLPGDNVALTDGSETGTQQATGYSDPDNDGVAAQGEKRSYARSPAGTPVAEVYLKGDGSIVIKSLLPGGGTIDLGAATQSFLRGEDFLAYLDAVITATSTAIGGVPVAGAGLKAAFDAAITAAIPLRTASVSQLIKGE